MPGRPSKRYRLDDYWPASGSGMMMSPNTFLNINDGRRDRCAVYGESERRWASAWQGHRSVSATKPCAPATSAATA